MKITANLVAVLGYIETVSIWQMSADHFNGPLEQMKVLLQSRWKSF
jgi:hypothetical protein